MVLKANYFSRLPVFFLAILLLLVGSTFANAQHVNLLDGIGPRLNDVEMKVANLQKSVDDHESRISDLESTEDSKVSTVATKPALPTTPAAPTNLLGSAVATGGVAYGSTGGVAGGVVSSVTYGPPVVTSSGYSPTVSYGSNGTSYSAQSYQPVQYYQTSQSYQPAQPAQPAQSYRSYQTYQASQPSRSVYYSQGQPTYSRQVSRTGQNASVSKSRSRTPLRPLRSLFQPQSSSRSSCYIDASGNQVCPN